MIMNHAVHREVFDANDAKGIDYLAALLMREIVTSPCNPLVHTRNDLAVLLSFRGAFSKFRVLPLYFCKGFFFFAKKARVIDFFTCRKRRKRLESYINADALG